MTTTTTTFSSRGNFWGGILILIGILILLDNLHIFQFDVWDIFWPIVLIFIGYRLIIKKRHNLGINVNINSSNSGMGGMSSATLNPTTGTSSNAGGSAEDYVNDSMVAGDSDHYVKSKSFRGGALSNVFGEVTIDVSGAELADGIQNLSLNTVFGEVKIILPAGMEFALEATTVFGDVKINGMKRGGLFSNVSFATPGYKDAVKKLFITPSTVFGEVKIITRE